MESPAETKKVPSYLEKLGKPSLLRRLTEYLFINIFIDLILWLGLPTKKRRSEALDTSKQTHLNK